MPSSPYKVEYQAVWPADEKKEYLAIEPTQDKEAFFEDFDLLCSQLKAMGCPKSLLPTVEVRALQWSGWVSYGNAQARGWTTNE